MNNPVILASFPKSGNTWVRFIIANTLNVVQQKVDKVDFHNVHDLMPSLSDNRESLFDGITNVLKTHSDWTRGFEKNVLILRNPSDVLYSYFHYLNKEKGVQWEMHELIHDQSKGMPAIIAHTESYMTSGKPLMVITYEKLQTTPLVELKGLFSFLEIDVDESAVKKGYELSTFDNMSKVEIEKGRKFGNADYKFTRSGVVGDGMANLTASQLNDIQKYLHKSPVLSLLYRSDFEPVI